MLSVAADLDEHVSHYVEKGAVLSLSYTLAQYSESTSYDAVLHMTQMLLSLWTSGYCNTQP